MTRFLGILREPLHSPNRKQDDAKILRAVGEELERHGARVDVLDAEAGVAALERGGYDIASPMCEALPRLRRIHALQTATILVNPPQAVLNCYRVRMVPFLKACPEAKSR